jgi:hypothetical protein
MVGFTKLFSSIVHSTVWREPNHVRLAWITMLALADKNGVVEASIPGLADAARISIEECEDALERFQQPDKYSRSVEHEGRRIKPIDGGWKLLNYEKYRGKLREEKLKEQNAERQRRYRQRGVTVTHSNAPVTQSDVTITRNAQSEAESEAESIEEKNTKKKKAGYGEDFERFWKAYPRKKAKGQAYRAWTKTKGNRPPLSELLEIVTRQANSPDWLRDGGQYIPYPATWLNGASWDDEDTLDPCAVAMSLLDKDEREER